MSALRIKLLRPVYYLGLFLVLVPLLVYFFSQNPPGARAISTITTSGVGNSPASRRQVVQSSNGTIVAVFSQSSGGIYFSKSTDNAATWSAPTQILAESWSGISVAIDGSDHIYVVYGTDVGNITSIKMTHSAGNWTAGLPVDVFSAITCNIGFNPGTFYSKPTITVNSSNVVWVNAVQQNTSQVDCDGGTELLTASSSDGSSWTNNSGNIGFALEAAPLLAIGNDLWTIIGGLEATYSGIWKDAGSTGFWTKITGDTSLPTVVSLSSGGSDQLDLFYENGSSVIVYRKYTISTTTLGSEITISSVANDVAGTISADTTNGNLWVFYQSYVAASSYNIVYKKYNGTTWDGSSTAITTDNLNNSTISSVIKRTGASYVPLIWLGGTDLKSHAVALVTGSAPAAPTLLFPPNSETGVVHRPHFELRATDADGDYLKYKIEICSASDCSVIVRTIDQTSSQTGWAGQDQQTSTAYTGSAILANSTIAQHNYQNPPLAVSTQYWWRAYAIDPGGGNTFSSPSSIFTFTTAAAIPIQFQPNTTIRGGTKIN